MAETRVDIYKLNKNPGFCVTFKMKRRSARLCRRTDTESNKLQPSPENPPDCLRHSLISAGIRVVVWQECSNHWKVLDRTFVAVSPLPENSSYQVNTRHQPFLIWIIKFWFSTVSAMYSMRLTSRISSECASTLCIF